jgi:hemerythrin superfamily protein
MSSEVYKMRENFVHELEKIANVTEIIQGMRPAGVDTYRGLQLLRDAADSSESELYGRWHEFIRNTSENKLAILQECIKFNSPDLTQMMETVRLNENMGIYQVKEFTGEDLRNNLNLVIEEIDYAGQSKSAEIDRLSGLIKSGLLAPMDIDDPIVKHQMIQRFGLGMVPLKETADISMVERLIQYMERHEFDLVKGLLKPYNNPVIMMRMLTDWMKSAKYETLDPQIKSFAEEQVLKPLREALALRQQPPPPMGGGAGGPPMPPKPGMAVPPPPTQNPSAG